jgi:hypothetical protein
MPGKPSDDAERLITTLKNHLGRDLTPEESKLLKLSVPVVPPIRLVSTKIRTKPKQTL